MSLLLRLPAEVLDVVFRDCFLEGWTDSKATCDLALGLRLVSRACDLSIKRLISADRSLRPDDDAQKALWRALVKGCPTVVIQRLLERTDVDPNCKDEHSQTPLSWSRHPERNFTALHFVAYRGNIASARLLLEKGADINAKDRWGKTALNEAIQSGKENAVRLLLEKGADIHDSYGGDGTALHEAAESGHAAVVGVLLEKGADINARDDWWKTPLHEAAANGHEKVVGLLLEKGANINAESGEARTALHEAAVCGHEKVVGLLLEKGADLDVKDMEGETALDKAFFSWMCDQESPRRTHRTLKRLLRKHEAVDTTNHHGETAQIESMV